MQGLSDWSEILKYSNAGKGTRFPEGGRIIRENSLEQSDMSDLTLNRYSTNLCGHCDYLVDLWGRISVWVHRSIVDFRGHDDAITRPGWVSNVNERYPWISVCREMIGT